MAKLHGPGAVLAAALGLATAAGCELVLGDLPPIAQPDGGGAGGTTGTTSPTTTATGTTTTLADGGCDPGLTACDGACVDEQADPTHCGSCGNACFSPVSGGLTGAPKCGGGSCDVTCNTTTPLDCAVMSGHACVDPQTDPQYCHDCNTHCPGGKTCQGGACVAKCGPQLTSCNGSCVYLPSDPSHCGACTTACNSVSPSCNGACILLSLGGCGTGQTACPIDGGLTACADTTKDPTHCGACGTACAADQVCIAGTCTPYIFVSAAWECGNGNSLSTYCQSSGVCVGAGVACP
jgi:hypothetical protein